MMFIICKCCQSLIIKYQQMDQKQLNRTISSRKFRQQDFLEDNKKMRDMINAVNEMEINQNAFKILRILIKYFRFPILILFRKFYDRIQQQSKVLITSEDQMKTAGIVVNIIEGKQYESLKFYTKAGITNVEQKKDAIEPKQFKKFIFDIDSQLHRIVGDKSKYQIDQLQSVIRKLDQFSRINKLTPIYEMCVQAYTNLAHQKIKQNESLLQYRQQKEIFDQRTKIQPQKIFIEQGSVQREIKDTKVSQYHLCCRPYFYLNEIINEPQTITQQYKHYSYPYNKFMNQVLLKTIVGFLNGKGGIIYIGIREKNDNKKRLIRGEIYNQSLKQDVLKHFRVLGQRIAPQIVNNQLYRLQYVPIRDENGFIAGRYIIRLRISRGLKDELYSFKNYDGQQIIAFRTANQVLQRKLGQQILQLYRQKLSQPQEPQESNHQGPCKKPDIGKPLYQNSNNNIYQIKRYDNF